MTLMLHQIGSVGKSIHQLVGLLLLLENRSRGIILL